MKRSRKTTRTARTKSEAGQSVIELVLTLFAFLTIFFMYTQVALSFGVGNYFQYATFMAARAYQSAYLSPQDQAAAANSVLTTMIQPGKQELFGSIAKGVAGTGTADVAGGFIGPSSRVQLGQSQDARNTAWEQGVTYTFKASMYLAPLIPGISTGDDSKITLESQSWLGREPTQQECEQGMVNRQSISGIKALPIYDNGC